MKSFLSFCLITTFVLLGPNVIAQSNKALADAEKYYSIRNYEQALPLFIDAIKAGEKNPTVHYKAGVCYQKTNNLSEQLKAIPYLDYALKNGQGIPVIAHFELGELLLKNEQIMEARASFEKYKSLTKADKKAQEAADRALDMTVNAMALMSVPRNWKIRSFPATINSQYTEYNPVVSADESVMAFTALRPNTGKTRSNEKFIEEIYISYNTNGNWSEPKSINLGADYHVGTAGISADGQQMMVFIARADDPGDLYVINRSGESWSKPSVLASTINSKYMESTASMTPDGKVIYFASNRIGGFGGMDIWKIEKRADGSWGQPVNLGPEINTKYDDDAPFIHPDQKTLFFTSEGHSSMGGKDIFYSKFVNGKWTRPENMGYPVNTTANDNYFTLTADGTKGFFSSDRKGGLGGQDLYFVEMPDNAANIALTMIKGKILNAETGKPMPTKIYVVDVETNQKLDFVYHPDKETGHYLVILPPAKNYDVIIESEGFLPYTLNVNIPGQTYFYELFQLINLKTIKQFDVVVGQEVEVKNAFYETNQAAKADVRKVQDAQLLKTGAIDAYDLMLELMAAQDQEAVDYLFELIALNNSVDDINFNELENSNIEVAKRVYYYDESDESKFEQKKVDGKVIFSLPTMFVTEESKKQKEAVARKSNYDKALLNNVIKIYFDAGKSDLKNQYQAQLDNILKSLERYPDLGVEISGFASAEGSEEMNREISNKRAIEVLSYLNHRGVVRRRIVAKGYGATKDMSQSKEEGRRVEVRLVDLNDSNVKVSQ